METYRIRDSGDEAMKNMITIKDVAERAGVSTTTVSLALNNKGTVGQETRQRVMEIAREMGYMPSNAAKSLVSNRTGIIGVAFPIPDMLTYTHKVLGPYVAFLSNRLNHWNQNCLVATKPYQDQHGFAQLVKSRVADGIIVMDVRMQDYRLDVLRQCNMPFALIGRPEDATGVHYVDIDAEQGGYLAARHLLELGHRHIVFYGTAEEQMGYTYRSLQGYRRALEEVGIACAPERIRIGEPVIHQGDELFAQLAAENVSFSAVITGDFAFAGAMATVVSQWPELRGRVQIAAFGQPSTRSMSEVAVDLLMSSINEPHTQALGVLYPPEVHILPASPENA